MRKRQLFVAILGIAMFAAILSWKSLVPVENLTGKANATYYIKFCVHSGDGKRGELLNKAGAVMVINFTSPLAGGLPTDLTSFPLGPSWTYDRPSRPPRRSDPVLGGPSGGSGTITYGGYSGHYFIYKDYATPIDVLSAPPGEPTSQTERIAWDFTEFSVTAPSVSGVDFGTGARLSCVKSESFYSDTISSGGWVINFPAKKSGNSNSVSGNARQIP